MVNWRNTLPAVENAGEYAMDQLLNVVDSAGRSARDMSSQIESWASDGFETIRDAAKSEPAFWGAVTIGMGALIGGILALWRSSGRKPQRGRAARTVAVSTAAGRSKRSTGAGMSAMPKRRRRRRRAPMRKMA